MALFFVAAAAAAAVVDDSEKSVRVWAKYFKCNWKILFSSFRKCYGLSLHDVNPWKYRILVFFCLLSSVINISSSSIFCAAINRKFKKWTISDILMTITLVLYIITGQKAPLFLSVRWALFVSIFHFRISRSSKLNPLGVPLHYVLLYKIHTCQRWHFQTC